MRHLLRFFRRHAIVLLCCGAMAATTLEQVKARGKLLCGVNPGPSVRKGEDKWRAGWLDLLP
jgi:hypothetical protein